MQMIHSFSFNFYSLFRSFNSLRLTFTVSLLLFSLSLSHSLSTSSVSLPLLIYLCLCLCLISTSLYLCLSIPHFYCANLFLLYRVWVDSRTVNVIASACTSTMNRVVVAALQFFLGSLISLSVRQREKYIDQRTERNH